MVRRVLYVDDEDALLDIGKTFLESIGDVEVNVAHSVNEAVQQIENESFDAIICDYQMPGASGLDLLLRLRKEGNEVPFILFTGRGREEVAIDALNSGADYYIKKGGEARSQFAELWNAINQAIIRREAEDAVEHNIGRFRTMIENIKDLLIEIDENHHITYISPALFEIAGYEPDDVIGIDILNFLVPDEVEKAKDSLAIVFGGKKVSTTYYRVKTKAGREIKLSTTSSRYMRHGKPYVIISARDVTMHLTMTAALINSAKNFQVYLEQSPEMVMMTDNRGIIDLINGRACRQLSITPELARTMTIWDLIYGYLRENHKTSNMYNYLKGGLFEGLTTGKGSLFNTPLEWTLHLPKGTWLYGELRFFLVPVEDGWNIILTIRDESTERRSGKKDSLAKRKAEVMGSIFHREISAQVSILRQHADLIERSPSQGQAVKSAEAIRRVGKRVDRVLEFLREYENVGNDDPIWQGLYELISTLAKKYDEVVINVDPSFHNVEVFADKNLPVVFDNLFENSIMHGEGVKEIKVTSEESSSCINIVIADDGKGIRNHPLDERRCRGHIANAGLGLILADEILSITDIKLKQRNPSDGHGAVFIIEVPRIKVRARLT